MSPYEHAKAIKDELDAIERAAKISQWEIMRDAARSAAVHARLIAEWANDKIGKKK